MPHARHASPAPAPKTATPVQRTAIPAPRAGDHPLQRQADGSPRVSSLQALQHLATRPAQRVTADDEELLQGKLAPAQRAAIDEEEPLQARFARITGSPLTVLRRVDPTTEVNGVPVNDDPALEHEADVMGAKAAQFVAGPEDEELLQGRFAPVQRATDRVADQVQGHQGSVVQAAAVGPNRTGLPDNLKAGVENLSGMSMDSVRVHYNSGKPAQLNALAYAQGTDIHLGPGQERHLPHEAWHVVQQNHGRARPTMQMKVSMPVHDDKALADVVGKAVVQRDIRGNAHIVSPTRDTVQFYDYGETDADLDMDFDEIGEENRGIRELPDKDKRPDDVPLVPEYRKAMHKLQNLALVLQKYQSEDKYKEIKEKILKIQKDVKSHAATYKTSMRNLASNFGVEKIKAEYVIKMQEITESIGETIESHCEGRYAYKDIKKIGSEIWREKYRKIRESVNKAIDDGWREWKGKLKDRAVENMAFDTEDHEEKNEWESRVRREKWEIFYGGSLAKGYKGPPKQGTRFFEGNFDVDANLNANPIAEYLINKEKKSVDRGQISVKEGEDKTLIRAMDEEIDGKVKKNLLTEKIIGEKEDVNNIISEEFETRVNAPRELKYGADKAVKLSIEDQKVRDRLTSLRKDNPEYMVAIGKNLSEKGLIQVDEQDENIWTLKKGLLTGDEIGLINKAIDDVTKNPGIFDWMWKMIKSLNPFKQPGGNGNPPEGT